MMKIKFKPKNIGCPYIRIKSFLHIGVFKTDICINVNGQSARTMDLTKDQFQQLINDMQQLLDTSK